MNPHMCPELCGILECFATDGTEELVFFLVNSPIVFVRTQNMPLQTHHISEYLLTDLTHNWDMATYPRLG